MPKKRKPTTTRTTLSNKAAGKVVLLLAAALIAVCQGCADTGRTDSRPVFAVCIEPHAFLLEKIGGDRIRIEVLVPAGKEPEHYQATPDKIAALSRAGVLFCTGMPFEENLVPKLRSISGNLEIVDLRVGIVLRKLELHSHGEEETSTGHAHHVGCSHDGLDPHIWFAPAILKTQAETIYRTLLEHDPNGENGDYYRRNYEALLESIETTRRELAEKLGPLKGTVVCVFHPSYGYFCDEFDLRQNALEFEGKSPKPQQLSKLIAEAKTQTRPLTIFVQPEFNRAPAEALAEATGGRIIVHSGLDRDVLKSMRRFADELVAAENADRPSGNDR